MVVQQLERSNLGLLAGDTSQIDSSISDNDLEIKKDAEERKLHRMAKVYDFWRCGRAVKTYVQLRRHHVPRISK